MVIPMDVLSPAQRHYAMARNTSKNTVPETQIRKRLHRAGLRYRMCDRRYPGSPDIILPRYYAVIFIHGCFWHAHENCRFFRFPQSNQLFWGRKFMRNKARDARVIREYQERCWRVCVVWECSIRGRQCGKKLDAVVTQILLWLEESDEPFLEIRGAAEHTPEEA